MERDRGAARDPRGLPVVRGPGTTVTVNTLACGKNGRGVGDANALGAGDFHLKPSTHKEIVVGQFTVPEHARAGTYGISVACDNGKTARGDLTVTHRRPSGHVQTGVGGSVGPDTTQVAAGAAVLAAAAVGGAWLLRRRASGARGTETPPVPAPAARPHGPGGGRTIQTRPGASGCTRMHPGNAPQQTKGSQVSNRSKGWGLAVAACVGIWLVQNGAETVTPPVPSAAQAFAAGPSVHTDAAADPLPPSAPVRLRIPETDVDAPMTRLGLAADGSLDVPPAKDRNLAGWYGGGTAPGAEAPRSSRATSTTRTGPPSSTPSAP